MGQKTAFITGLSCLLMVAFAVGVVASFTGKASSGSGSGQWLMSADGNGKYPLVANQNVWNLLQLRADDMKPNVVVAQDGSGTHKSIQEAINTVPAHNNKTFIILIKAGIYKEYVNISKGVLHTLLVGEGPDKTIITGNKYRTDHIGTFNTATVVVEGNDFMAKGITIENSAGAIKGQAVALRVSANRSILYNCHLNGFQDTLYTHKGQQFYRDCIISGTIDFIFGDGQAVFQNCTIMIKKPLPSQYCVVTAQGREQEDGKGAIVLQNCIITGTPEFLNAKPTIKAFLGRPWKAYSRTIIMRSYINGIDPEGWVPMNGSFGIDTCFYAEFENINVTKADMDRRVKWPGIKKITRQEAESFTPGRYIEGDSWVKPTGVPYDSGMIKV